MMFIIEGSDCLGKTTIANKIVDGNYMGGKSRKMLFPIYYQHMTRPNENFNFFTDYKDMMSKYAVMDRFHFGGIVYHNRITVPMLKVIEGWLALFGTCTTLVYASDEKWYKDHVNKLLVGSRKEMFNVEDILMYNRKFIRLADPAGLDVPKYDNVFDISNSGFVGDYAINVIVNEWIERLSLVPRNGVFSGTIT